MTVEREPMPSPNAVAVVGMAFRFPGASDAETFWNNLANGVESIRRFSREELIAAGVSPELAGDPRFVSAHGAIDEIECFDADFFGYSPAEAALIDPQQRLFLTCAYEALEDAGIAPGESAPVTGVFGGCGVNFYLIQNVVPSLSFDDVAAVYQGILGGEKDFMTARVAYKLGLRGPSITIQAACATSLVAVHAAAQSLLSGECDLALAGGVSLRIPQTGGFLFAEGGIYSADGRCRAFDEQAGGTAGGSGGGVVALKRLADAQRDGDAIRAVILGTAVTNDGAVKLSFTAPAVRGQAAAIMEARAVAGVPAESIAYAEMHGTGTVLGDPIEIAAMREALGVAWHPGWRCFIGSLKTNVGHLDTAAGVAGLIKTVLMLEHGAIPPTLHFQRPNPKIDFASGPLRVATTLMPWPREQSPRRASVSSFGLGGNNCHAVLEEAPATAPRRERAAWRLFPLSARTPRALERMRSNLAASLEANGARPLTDVAWTLAQGRQFFAHCGFAVADSTGALVERLQRDWQSGERPAAPPRIGFLYPGQGAQQAGAGRELYAAEPAFRDALDLCAQALLDAGGPDVRPLLLQEPSAAAEAEIRRTVNAQALLFALGYALTALWRARGIVPDGVLGHSSGEYAAAVCAGVISLPVAARALMTRARLMEQLPPGVMAAVGLSEAELRSSLPDGVHLAAVNAAQLCTVAGRDAAVRELEARLGERGVPVIRLQTAHAFHSPEVDPVLPAFRNALAGVELRSPELCFYSAVTGARAEEGSAADVELWVRQIREPVRFGPAIEAMLSDGFTAFVELGAGTTLTGLARRAAPKGTLLIPGIPPANEACAALSGLGRLWLAGCAIDWNALFTGDEPRRVALPTYPFERTRHWIERPARVLSSPAPAPSLPKDDDEPGLFVPAWTRSSHGAARTVEAGLGGAWLVVGAEDPLTQRIVERLRAAGAKVELRTALDADAPVNGAERVLFTSTRAAPALEGFRALIRFARGLAREGGAVREIAALTAGAVDVTGGEPLAPWQATVLAPLLVIAEEFPGLATRGIDLAPDDDGELARAVLSELSRPAEERVVALRHGHRWTCRMAPLQLAAGAGSEAAVRAGEVYLITGGLGALGLTVAKQMAASAPIRLALIGRSPVAQGSEAAAAIASIEQSGSTVHVYQADCADASAMRRVVADLTQRYGRIRGVIHAAGIAGGGAIARRTDEEMAAVLRPKTTGTEILIELLADTEPDFLAFFSSLAAYMPVPGQADYAAANAFLDISAAQLRRRGVRATSIDWDAFRDLGMAVAAELPEALRLRREEELAALGLDPERLCEALWRALAADLAGVVVSRRRSFTEAPAPATAARAAGESVEAGQGVTGGLAGLWSALLGVAEIKADDDFFELGGHSLLATSLTFQIRQRLGCAIGVDEVFLNSTFAAMARLVEGRAAVSDDREALLL